MSDGRAARRRGLFSQSDAAYEDGRPGYPPEVFDLLTVRCGLGPGARVLEIGPGPGQATAELAERGAEVLAVELDAAFAARLAERLPQVRVVVGAFEEVALPDERFDLVVAATSFHWVPVAEGLARCARLLRPGGWLALWWTYFGDPSRPDPVFDAVAAVVAGHGLDVVDLVGTRSWPPDDPPRFLDADGWAADVAAAGAFEPLRTEVVPWSAALTPSGVRGLFGSFSPWLDLEAARREAMLDEVEAAARRLGPVVWRPCLTAVHLARRVTP